MSDKPTARELLAHYFGREHAAHSPRWWYAEQDEGDVHFVSVDCSCGRRLFITALGEVVRRLEFAFRHVPTVGRSGAKA